VDIILHIVVDEVIAIIFVTGTKAVDGGCNSLSPQRDGQGMGTRMDCYKDPAREKSVTVIFRITNLVFPHIRKKNNIVYRHHTTKQDLTHISIFISIAV
jgi:hypothetical protein